MSCTPVKNRHAARLSLLFVIAGILLMAAGGYLPYSGFFQLIAVAFITAGIQLLVRFTLTDYRYIIEDNDDGSADLLVYKKQGAREYKVCHISLSRVEEIFPRGQKKTDANTRFNYCQNLSAPASVLLYSNGTSRMELILEPDEAFLAALRARIGTGGGGMNFVM